MSSQKTSDTALQFKQRVLDWVKTMHDDGEPVWKYKMNEGSDATVFNSCFAVYLRHLFNDLENLTDNERREWINYIQSFQEEDTGFFCDPTAKDRVTDASHDDTHLKYQLTTFCVSALEALGSQAQYPLKFVDEWKNADKIIEWFDSLDWKVPWNCGNKVMFLAICLAYQYHRFNDQEVKKVIDVWFDWMDSHQNPATGFWGVGKDAEYFQGMGGFYHQFVIYNYFGRKVNYADRVVDRCLFLQQPDGLFYPGQGGGTCDDIDGIEPLVYFYHKYDYRRDEIRSALRKALHAIVNDQNKDGGFSWAPRAKGGFSTCLYLSTLIFRHFDLHYWYWCCRKGLGRGLVTWQYKEKTGWNKVGRDKWDSSLFDAWLRCQTISEICTVLTDEPYADLDLSFLTTPGVGWFSLTPQSLQKITEVKNPLNGLSAHEKLTLQTK